MKKITVRIGQYDSTQKNVSFRGELVVTYQEFEVPENHSQGTEYELYRVSKGYRVYEKRWTNGQGDKRQNYAKLSDVLTQVELLEKFELVANYAGIFETVELDEDEEKTILLAANSDGARLLPYTLESVEELILLGKFVIDQEEIPEDIKGEFKSVLEGMEDG